MLGFWKKKRDRKKFEAEQERLWSLEYPLLEAIALKLPSEYEGIKKSINPDNMMGRIQNDYRKEKGWADVLLDQFGHTKYETEKNRYLLEGIKVYSSFDSQFVEVKLDVYNNNVIGWYINSNERQLDLKQIQMENMTKFDYDDPTYQKYINIVGVIPDEISDQLNLKNGFEIELESGEKHFTIKELGNGDYISVNEKGEIFGLIHEINLIEKVFNKPPELFDALAKGQFNFETYLNEKLG